jgi:CubicO group peptidase (beta-lactamase class C family)
MERQVPMSDSVEQLDALFAPWATSDAPGLAVGVVLDGRTIYKRGFGMASLETAKPITPQTKLRIGSTTKHFTALLALLLAEEGKLDLDAAIRTYIPELAGPGGDPTLRQLLQHRGGSRCYLDLGFIAHGMATPPEGWALATQVRQTGRNFAPGEAMIYNNGGYHLVSLAIERAGGTAFAEQLRARLLEPLGLGDTVLHMSDHRILPGMATLHVPLPDGGWRRGLFPVDQMLGEGGIVSTIDDMLVWTRHLASRDRFGAARTWAALVEQPRFEDGSIGPYALGLMVGTYRGRRVIHHAGGVIGGSSQMLTFPDDRLDIVILANGATGADPIALAERVADILLADILGPPPAQIDADRYRAAIGHWWSADTGMVYAIADEQEALKFGFCGGPLQPIRPVEMGRGLVSTGSIGDIIIDLQPEGDGRLAIRFGGRTDRYTRLEPGLGDVSAFGERALGRYHSEDADCTVHIERHDSGLCARFGDLYGQSQMQLEPLGPNVAIARRSVGQLPFTVAITLRPEGGFIASTGRTRFLQFDRS